MEYNNTTDLLTALHNEPCYNNTTNNTTHSDVVAGLDLLYTQVNTKDAFTRD